MMDFVAGIFAAWVLFYLFSPIALIGAEELAESISQIREKE